VEAVAVLAAIVVGALGRTILIRRRRAKGGAALDRTARQRIALRVAEIPGAPDPDAARGTATHHLGDPGSRSIHSRRLLWRDASVVLTLLGVALLAVLVIDRPGPTGSVLQETATPPARIANTRVDAYLGASAQPATPRASPTTKPTASALPAATEPTVTEAPRQSVALPTSRAGPGPTSDRMAVLTACPDAPDCYTYMVRRRDNLISIANWFGIPYSTVLSLNPQLRDPSHLHAGDRIRLPTPRR
jgi:LysM domain